MFKELKGQCDSSRQVLAVLRLETIEGHGQV